MLTVLRFGLLLILMIAITKVSSAQSSVQLLDLHPDNSTTLEHPGVTTSQQCWNMCLNNPQCSAMVYHSKFQGCYLKTGNISGWKPWNEGFTVVKNRSSVKLDGLHPDSASELEHPGVTTGSECREMCQTNSRCKAAVYSQKYKGCYLKTGKISGWRNWPEGYTVVIR